MIDKGNVKPQSFQFETEFLAEEFESFFYSLVYQEDAVIEVPKLRYTVDIDSALQSKFEKDAFIINRCDYDHYTMECEYVEADEGSKFDRNSNSNLRYNYFLIFQVIAL